MEFLHELMRATLKILLLITTSITGICLGAYVRNKKEFQVKWYYRKQRRKNRVIGKVRASLERYYISMNRSKKSRETKKRRSQKICYIQCVRILKKAEPEERRALRAGINANMKARETWGILLAVATVLGGYIVKSYAGMLTAALSKAIPQMNNSIMEEFIGVLWFAFMFLLTYFIIRDASMEKFILSIIEDIENK